MLSGADKATEIQQHADSTAETTVAIKYLQAGKAPNFRYSGKRVNFLRSSEMPTSSTYTKTRLIVLPVTTTAGPASSAFQARY